MGMISGATIAGRLPHLAAFLYLIGAIFMGISMGFGWLVGRPLPQWAWWQYLIAPLGVGVAVVILEFVFQPVGKWLRWSFDPPLTMAKALSGFLCVGFLLLLVMAPLFVQSWLE